MFDVTNQEQHPKRISFSQLNFSLDIGSGVKVRTQVFLGSEAYSVLETTAAPPCDRQLHHCSNASS